MNPLAMPQSAPIQRISDKRWELAMLRRDIKDLQREKSHLDHMSSRRSLTGWELSRMEQLLDELMEVLERLSIAKTEEFTA